MKCKGYFDEMFEKDQVQGHFHDLSSIEWNELECIVRTEKSSIYKSYFSIGHKRIPVAIKLVDSRKLAKEEVFEMIISGNRIHLSLDHPNIVKPYDSFCRDGVYSFIMEYLDGCHLGQIPKIPCQQLLHVGSHIARALLYLRDNRLIHGDVRPTNIILCNDGTAKLIDFDLCHFISDKSVGYGGVPFLASEQFEGRQTFDSDLFALGVSLSSVLTGGLLGRMNPSKIDRGILSRIFADSFEENFERYKCANCTHGTIKLCIWYNVVIPGLINEIPSMRYDTAILLRDNSFVQR